MENTLAARPDWLVLPDDPEYVWTRRRYAGRHDRLAGAVARCRSAWDVAEALSYAHGRGLRVAVRSSGHSYADHSSTGGLLIDLSGMRDMAVGRHEVTVGSGQILGRLSNELALHGKLVPSGSCPTVAIGGIALAGGFGFRGRMHGLTADQLVRATIVLADGSITTADDVHDAELFWALRGAGAGNFGVVTSVTLRTYPLTGLHGLYARWPLEHAVTVLDTWQHWAPYLPENSTVEAYLVASDYDDEPAHVEIWGVTTSSGLLAEASALVGVPAEKSRVFKLCPTEAAKYLCGWTIRDNEPLWVPEGPFERPARAYVKSEFFDYLVPASALAALADSLVADRAYGEYRDVEFTPWRGAYARLAGHESAFIHRDPHSLISHTVLNGSNATPERLRGAETWLARSHADLHPYGSGHVYQGYPDPDLPDWGRAYYGHQLRRLQAIKSKYDPDSVFTFAQSL